MTKIKKYQNKNGETRFQFQVYLGVDPQTGKSKSTRRRELKSKREAEILIARLQTEFADQSQPSQNNIKFKAVYDQWYQAYINTVRVSTYARTASTFANHILPIFGDMRIRTIRINDVQTAVNSWFKIAPVSGYKRWYQYTTNVIDYAIKLGYITGNNPAKAVTLPKRKLKGGDQPENYWSRDQVKQFLGWLDDPQQYALFRTLAYSGVRRGECLALTWADINLTKGTLRVNKTITQGLRGENIVQPPKTNAGYRTVPLDSGTLRTLKKWHSLQRELYLGAGINAGGQNQLVFASTKNKWHSLNTPAKWLNKYFKANPDTKPITIHGLRKSYCTALVAAKLPIKEVQRRMGHDDIQTTLDVYSFVTDEQIQESTAKFEQYINL